jgi:hypothetical protein
MRLPTILPPDPDALAYIAAVETADGQALEEGVKSAFDNFFKGLKQDGIFSAIKASCILAGARTLPGALVPLVGTAPTNINFVSADYNRKTGLKGNGSTKYLNSNRTNNADPQNNNHNAVFSHTIETGSSGGFYMGAGGGTTGANNLTRGGSLSPHASRQRSSTRTEVGGTTPVSGFFGTSRNGSGAYTHRDGGTKTTIFVTSQFPSTDSVSIFARNASGTQQFYSNSTLKFYSIGESLDLDILDSHVSTLMTALGAAIP